MPKRITKGNLWGLVQSRSYTSVSDIRRTFAIATDDAVAIQTTEGRTYVGLPAEVAELVRQLYQDGRVLLDLNPDVKARVIQGMFPARLPAASKQVAPHPIAAGSLAAAAVAPATRAGGRRKRRRRSRRQGSSLSAAQSAPSAANQGMAG